MAEDRLTHIAVGFTPIAAGHRQAQQPQWIEWVARGHLHLDAVGVGQPHHLSIGPVTLGCNLCRAELAVVLEQRRKQDRLVSDAVALAHQYLGQLLERQIGIGRDEVEVKGDVFHARIPGAATHSSGGFGAEPASDIFSEARCTRRCQTTRLPSSSMPDQAAISSSVRKQPSHNCPADPIRQTEMHGDGINWSFSLV